MVAAFVVAAAVSMALAWYSWRRPALAESLIRRYLNRDGWLRLVLFFLSASAFFIALAVVSFREWPIPIRVILRLRPAAV